MNRSLPAPAAVSSAPGQRIVLQVVVEGVKGNVDKGLPRLKTRSGEPYDPQVVEDDVRLLLKSRKYVNVSPKVQPVSGGVIVIFQVVERPTIKYIKIVGCENKLRSSLLSKTDLKEKDSLDPYAVKEARDKLETYYHESGYDRVRVTIAEGLTPGDQGVVLLIDEGRSQKIWTTNFVGNKFVSAARLATQISSNPPMLYSRYLYGGGFKGEADRKKIDEDVEKLTAYYRAFGFFQAKIGREWTFDEQENWMYLTFVINEGPQYKVRSISFIGEKTFDTARLSKDTKLHANEFFNQGAMNHDLATVRDLYGTYGFVFADIQADPRLLEESAQLDLVYNIKEGARYRVGKINISILGDSPHTSYATILDRLSLRPGDILDTTKLRKDERRLAGCGLYETKDPNKKPKIVFSPPPGMEDADKQLAKRSDGRAGWAGGSSSSGSGSSSSSTPFGPGTGSGYSSSGSANSGSASAGTPNFRGQTPDSDADQILDVDFQFEPRQQSQPQAQQPQQTQQQPRQQRVSRGVEWIDPLQEAGEGNDAKPAEHASHDDDPQGPVIRGQEPSAGGFNTGATGPDGAARLPYNPAPQYPATMQVAQAQGPYYPPVNGGPPSYVPAPNTYPQPTVPNGSYPAATYPPTTYPPANGYPQPGAPVQYWRPCARRSHRSRNQWGLLSNPRCRSTWRRPGAISRRAAAVRRTAVARYRTNGQRNANRKTLDRRRRQLRRGARRQHRHRRAEFRSAALPERLGRFPHGTSVPRRRRSIADRARAGHASAKLRDQLAKSVFHGHARQSHQQHQLFRAILRQLDRHPRHRQHRRRLLFHSRLDGQFRHHGRTSENLESHGADAARK